MGVMGFCLGYFRIIVDKEKNDFFYLLIKLKYYGFGNRFNFMLNDILEIVGMSI